MKQVYLLVFGPVKALFLLGPNLDCRSSKVRWTTKSRGSSAGISLCCIIIKNTKEVIHIRKIAIVTSTVWQTCKKSLFLNQGTIKIFNAQKNTVCAKECLYQSIERIRVKTFLFLYWISQICGQQEEVIDPILV